MLLAAVLWSTGGAGIKILSGFPPLAVSGGRSAVSAVCFFLLLRGRVRPPRDAGIWPWAGAAAYCSCVSLYVASIGFTTAANAIILQYTALIWIALLGWAVLGERPSASEVVAVLLGATGVLLCMGKSLTLFAANGSPGRALIGDAMAVASGLGYALVTLSLRKMALRPGRDRSPVISLFYGNVAAAAIGLPMLLRMAGAPGVPGQHPAFAWTVLLWLGVGQLAGGYWCYQRGLRTTRALTASLISLLEPLLNPLWVALFVGEMPSRGTIVGGGLILASVVLSLAARQQQPGASDTS